MQRYQAVSYALRASASAPVTSLIQPGTTITVYESGTLTPAALYEDVDGVTPQANPFTSDAVTGRYSFCAQNGLYDIVLSKTGTTTYTLPQILLNEALAAVPRIWPFSIPHADLLTWPSAPTGIEIVPAPAAGIVRVYLTAWVATNFAVAYTNVSADGYAYIGYGGSESALASAYLPNTGAPDNFTEWTDLLSASPTATWLSPWNYASDKRAGNWGLVAGVGPLSLMAAQPLCFVGVNTGNLTGGQAGQAISGFVMTYDWTIPV